jgi:hypothetical protein
MPAQSRARLERCSGAKGCIPQISALGANNESRACSRRLTENEAPNPEKNDSEQKRVKELERKNAKLREDLKRAETIIAFPKMSQIFWEFREIWTTQATTAHHGR